MKKHISTSRFARHDGADQLGFTIPALQRWCHLGSAPRRRPRVARQAGADQLGFTIVELMIATVVFSLVLLVITYGVLRFTNDYYKGVNSSNTQNTAQAALDTISQAIQFSAKGTSPADLASQQNGVFCAGTKLFLYDKGVAYTGATADISNPASWGIYMITNPNLNNCTKTGLTNAELQNGTQLLGKSMRATDIALTQSVTSPTVWQISLQVAFGDSDLLCNSTATSGPGKCSGASGYALGATVLGDDVRCRTITGAQFCSVVALSTIAEQRIQ